MLRIYFTFMINEISHKLQIDFEKYNRAAIFGPNNALTFPLILLFRFDHIKLENVDTNS